jgi:hypothetical protein
MLVIEPRASHDRQLLSYTPSPNVFSFSLFLLHKVLLYSLVRPQIKNLLPPLPKWIDSFLKCNSNHLYPANKVSVTDDLIQTIHIHPFWYLKENLCLSHRLTLKVADQLQKKNFNYFAWCIRDLSNWNS